MEGRSRKRLPSIEELELWAHVTREDEPLPRARSRGPAEPSGGKLLESASQSRPTPAPSPEPESPKKPAKAVREKPISPPPHAPFDARLSKRIARGRQDIDGRLDLHGLRQQDAYVALRRFLAESQAAGHRHVLIITGKGGKVEEFAERDFWNGEQRGVLRRLVPHWLAEPALRHQVVSFTESALRHGGSGALYVTIRKAATRPKP